MKELPETLCEFARGLLNECNTFHSDCFHEEEKQLPSRVLEVSGSLEAPFVRLIESQGMRGCYCALSHRWGPADKQPLKTTRMNLQDHLSEIPLKRLPKTFRHAVLFTRGLGISYLWIDSLCIIQDNNQDWHSEAQGMGALYHNATLVIAAAGSQNSTGGLFITKRPQSAVIQIPHEPLNVVDGSFYITLARLDPSGATCIPNRGPLRARAWAFQEWHLARRLLFFMPGGMSWLCRESELTERGNYRDLGLAERKSWLHLLSSYSSKSLTYPSDRIHAIRGIVAQMQKTRNDEFLFDYGVWQNGLIEQLVWRQYEQNFDKDALQLPTWSWAATGGEKAWCIGGDRYVTDDITVSRNLVKALDVTSIGSLKVAGNLISLDHAVERIPCGNYVKDSELIYLQETEFIMLACTEFSSDLPKYIIWGGRSGGEALGLAVFDHERVRNPKYFFLASSKRSNDWNW